VKLLVILVEVEVWSLTSVPSDLNISLRLGRHEEKRCHASLRASGAGARVAVVGTRFGESAARGRVSARWSVTAALPAHVVPALPVGGAARRDRTGPTVADRAALSLHPDQRLWGPRCRRVGGRVRDRDLQPGRGPRSRPLGLCTDLVPLVRVWRVRFCREVVWGVRLRDLGASARTQSAHLVQ
jgi:hypothetical protein